MLTVEVTGLDKLLARMKESPDKLQSIMEKRLGRSLLMVQSESQRRAPVATGLLRSSIGGGQGYSIVESWLKASVGTNVKYAVYVHENESAFHSVGDAKFMEKGADAAIPFIQKEIQQGMEELAIHITS